MEDPIKEQIITVVIEYSPSKKRVTVRGAWKGKDVPCLPLLDKDNYVNHVQVFTNHDHGYHVGFAGLSMTKEKHK